MKKRSKLEKKVSRKEPHKILVDWLEKDSDLSHLTIWERFHVTINLWFAAFSADESTYQEMFKRLGRPAVCGSILVMGELVTAMMHEPRDYLGKAYQEVGMNDKKSFAQYFTSDPVAECMARMQVIDLTEQQIRGPQPFRIGEPTLGTGVMLIHAVNGIREKHGEEVLRNVELVGVDKDLLCCKMGTLQLKWMALPLYRVTVWCGDSLDKPEKLKFVSTFGVANDLHPELPVPATYSRKIKVPQ